MKFFPILVMCFIVLGIVGCKEIDKFKEISAKIELLETSLDELNEKNKILEEKMVVVLSDLEKHKELLARRGMPKDFLRK